jgi:glycosyltransferase involved in cell wall biosynthesis
MTTIVSVVIPVYRDWQRAMTLIESLERQTLSSDIELDIIVVDDGSNDQGSSALAMSHQALLVTLPENRGRAAARNVGFKAAKGGLVIFTDCDCIPGDNDYVNAHVQAMNPGVVASIGHVFGVGGGFWDRYQQRASRRRESRYRAGETWMGTTQNMAVQAEAFRTVGGFDERYLQYGFEDRDLLLRLSRIGHIAWSDEAPVHHTDDLHLDTVARKMTEGARYSAPLFAHEHPVAYQSSGYASVDSGLHPWLRIPAILVGPLAARIARLSDPLLHTLPFRVASLLVSSVSALAYLHGSATRETKEP